MTDLLAVVWYRLSRPYPVNGNVKWLQNTTACRLKNTHLVLILILPLIEYISANRLLAVRTCIQIVLDYKIAWSMPLSICGSHCSDDVYMPYTEKMRSYFVARTSTRPMPFLTYWRHWLGIVVAGSASLPSAPRRRVKCRVRFVKKVAWVDIFVKIVVSQTRHREPSARRRSKAYLLSSMIGSGVPHR